MAVFTVNYFLQKASSKMFDRFLGTLLRNVSRLKVMSHSVFSLTNNAYWFPYVQWKIIFCKNQGLYLFMIGQVVQVHQPTLWISSNNNLISSIFESIFVWCLRKHIWRSHFFFHKRIFWVRPQSINCLVRVSFALKNGAGGRKQKRSDFLKKSIYILPAGYLIWFAK